MEFYLEEQAVSFIFLGETFEVIIYYFMVNVEIGVSCFRFIYYFLQDEYLH